LAQALSVSVDHYSSAREQAAAVRERRISARELLELTWPASTRPTRRSTRW
jgi:hypothetical protein